MMRRANRAKLVGRGGGVPTGIVAILIAVTCGCGPNAPTTPTGGGGTEGSSPAGGGVARDSGQPPPDGTACLYDDRVCQTDCPADCIANPACSCCTTQKDPGVYCNGQCMKQGTVKCGSVCTDLSADGNCGACGVTCTSCTACGPSGGSYACLPVAGVSCGGTISNCGSGPPTLICHCPSTCECSGGTTPSCQGGSYECWCNGPTGMTCASQGDCCCSGGAATCKPGGC